MHGTLARQPTPDLRLVTPPAGAPNGVVTLAQAKAQMRIEHDDDDDLINTLCDAATAHLDPGGRGWLGIALMRQQWSMTLGHFPGAHGLDPELQTFVGGYGAHGAYGPIDLPYPPLISVDSVTYYDAAGALQTLGTDGYQVSGVGSRGKGRISLSPGSFWPSTQWGNLSAVSVQFTCGHVAASDIPASIRQAILLLAGHLYENREAAVVSSAGSVTIAELPLGVDMLLAPMRIHL